MRKLFASQHRANRRALLSSGGQLLFYNYALAYANPKTPLQQAATGAIAGYTGFQLYVFVRAIVRQRRYRVGRENRLLLALARGEALPRLVRKRLVDEYFRNKSDAP